MTTFRRVAPPDYADGTWPSTLTYSVVDVNVYFSNPTGIYAPRLSSNGSNLASARLISLVAFNGTSVPQPNFTLSIMQFGQFIIHDMELTNQVSFGKAIICFYHLQKVLTIHNSVFF